MLKQLRKEKRYTQKEMAEILGVSRSYYEKIEYGIRKPSRAFLEKLLSRFPEVDLSKLIKLNP